MLARRHLAHAALALLSLLPLSGCSIYDVHRKCGFSGCADDAQITARIEASLYDDKAIEAWGIKVQTLDRTVYLYGIVDTDLERNIVEAIARETQGVENVVDSIAVRGNSY